MPEPKLPEIYFDLTSGGFLTELVPGRYVTMSERQIANQMMLDGHEELTNKDSAGLTKFSRLIAVAQRKNYVDYAGPLAGYKAGSYSMSGGKRVLVTESVRPVEPGKSKECPKIERFLEELCNHDSGQLCTVLAWLKVSWESLCAGTFMPGQLLVLAGPPACGKTFFQWFVTQLLGGRSAKPYRYMTGSTNFNSDLARAEHLPMGDVAASYDIRARKNFASMIKEFCVEPEMSIHGKGKEALTLTTYRRLTLSVNNEPEHLLIIPPLDSDIADKITLILCGHAELSENREENQREFLAELPAFAAFLKSYRIPKSIRDSRFGVRSFHHAKILEAVAESSPENQLLNIIDDVCPWNDETGYWRGSAEQLKVRLIHSDYSISAMKLLEWSAACGTYLARLKVKYPDRFEKRVNKGKTVWIVRRPNAESDEAKAAAF